MANIKIKALTSDLNGAAQAAKEHFRQAGVSRDTVAAFVVNCREAGLKVGRQGDTLILAH